MSIDLNDIKSNGARTCAFCRLPINAANDSGWEVFVEPQVTQPVCIFCDEDIHYKAGDVLAGEDIEQ